jgi:hypothetical protein
MQPIGSWTARLGILAAALTLLPGLAMAGQATQDSHLKCYKAKDPAAKTAYTADLLTIQTSFPQENGCTISVPAKMLCSPVSKTNVQPPPPGGEFGVTLTEEFACYKVKCPKGEFQLSVTDQFGSRSVTVKAPKLLCAPANTQSPV